MKRTVLVICLLCGCGKSQVAPTDWAAATTPEQQRAFLNALADSCSLPHDFFRLRSDSFVIQPRADEDYQKVDCALAALKRVRPVPKYFFVGNEYVVGNEQ